MFKIFKNMLLYVLAKRNFGTNFSNVERTEFDADRPGVAREVATEFCIPDPPKTG